MVLEIYLEEVEMTVERLDELHSKLQDMQVAISNELEAIDEEESVAASLAHDNLQQVESALFHAMGELEDLP